MVKTLFDAESKTTLILLRCLCQRGVGNFDQGLGLDIVVFIHATNTKLILRIHPTTLFLRWLITLQNAKSSLNLFMAASPNVVSCSKAPELGIGVTTAIALFPTSFLIIQNKEIIFVTFWLGLGVGILVKHIGRHKRMFLIVVMDLNALECVLGRNDIVGRGIWDAILVIKLHAGECEAGGKGGVIEVNFEGR